MLMTKQRSRGENASLESSLLQGRVTRSRLKDFNKTVEEEKQEKDSIRSGASTAKDPNKLLLEIERQRKQNKLKSEKSAREQRRQKRLLRNEFMNTDEIKQELGKVDWSKREVLREFNRLRTLRKKEKRNRVKKVRTTRARKGSINTEDESDLFENPEDFEWPDAEIQLPEKQTLSGRPVTKKEKDSEDDEIESLKIMMEANIYRLLGIQETGMKEMKILYGEEKEKEGKEGEGEGEKNDMVVDKEK
jgi:hypothetical protein